MCIKGQQQRQRQQQRHESEIKFFLCQRGKQHEIQLRALVKHNVFRTHGRDDKVVEFIKRK